MPKEIVGSFPAGQLSMACTRFQDARCNAVLDGLDRSESWAQSLLLLRLVEVGVLEISRPVLRQRVARRLKDGK